MFGNPNLSATPVDDLYRTQADTYGNSFANPVNAGNMNPGWGMNPSLMTPAYTAGYRPQYNGPQSTNEYGRVGFFRGVGNLNPMSPDIPWGNPFQHQQQSIESVTNRPADAAMWGAQRILAPALAWRLSSSMMGGMRGTFGMGFGLGKGLGSGIARGMGFGASGMVARGAGMAMGGALGAAATFALPYAAMQAGMWGLEKSVFNPYINTRQTAQDLRQNFSGVTFGDSTGNAVHGGGLGFGESTGIAQSITSQGINDMTFSTSQYTQGASMMARAGLMDNVNSKGISKRVKEGMEQVKLIMSIASMPEMKDAIEQLAKLNLAGASINGGLHSTASATMMQMSGLASIAGTSVQKLMNTVGAQGQYLYQANGMTPYLGQLAAATSYSTFATGKRLGLISDAQMARMGGLDGATQSSLTGQINATQTLFNKMNNYNAYIGGTGRSGNAITAISRFGGSMAADPLGAYGSMQMYSGQMGGKQIDQMGSVATEQQLLSIAQQMNIVGKNGKITAERAFPILTEVMGLSSDQAIAFLSERQTQGKDGAHELAMKALNSDYTKQSRQYISSNGLYSGLVGTPIYATKKFGRDLVDNISKNVVNPLTSGLGSLGDNISAAVDWAWFGGSVNSGGSMEELGLSDSSRASDAALMIRNARTSGGSAFRTGRGNSAGANTNVNVNYSEGLGSFDNISGLTDLGREKQTELMYAATSVLMAKDKAGDKFNAATDQSVAYFMKLSGEVDPTKAVQRAITIAKRTSAAGYTGLVSTAHKSKGKFANKDLEAKYNTAVAAGDMKKAGALRLQDWSEKNGGLHVGGDKGAMGHTDHEVAGVIALEDSRQQNISKNDDLYKEGRIDFQTHEAIANSLDNRQSTRDFQEAVTEFGLAVKEMRGAGKTSTGGSGGGVLRQISDALYGDKQKSQDKTAGNK